MDLFSWKCVNDPTSGYLIFSRIFFDFFFQIFMLLEFYLPYWIEENQGLNQRSYIRCVGWYRTHVQANFANSHYEKWSCLQYFASIKNHIGKDVKKFWFPESAFININILFLEKIASPGLKLAKFHHKLSRSWGNLNLVRMINPDDVPVHYLTLKCNVISPYIKYPIYVPLLVLILLALL